MNIDDFREDDMSLVIEGVRASTHKITARLNSNARISTRFVAEDHDGVCDIFWESKRGRTRKKIFSTELYIGEEGEMIMATIWCQNFFTIYPNADNLVKEELLVCKELYGLLETDFQPILDSSD